MEHIDDIIIALPLAAHDRMTRVVCELHDLPVRVWVIPDYFALALHRAQAEDVAGVPMLDLRAPALSEYQRMVKRGFDLVLSLLSMPFILPLMAVVALAIWLDDGGPIFFCPRRAGENGREFKMLKFRTMVAGAENCLQALKHSSKTEIPVHKIPNDPRVTRVGRFLRRTSLDELPQFVNVLRGEMSLVGPRPEIPELVECYDIWQRKRFAVPQGMTGWWQTNGRSDKPMHLHTDEDLYYVQNYSIWLDLQILCKTVWVVLHGKGAY
jgi:exopolysaccharide biosynthesis polyprenyl glycosylphosphotransferase